MYVLLVVVEQIRYFRQSGKWATLHSKDGALVRTTVEPIPIPASTPFPFPRGKENERLNIGIAAVYGRSANHGRFALVYGLGVPIYRRFVTDLVRVFWERGSFLRNFLEGVLGIGLLLCS